jgi:septal ring factor EnvC (AmiA/AmiB activator)
MTPDLIKILVSLATLAATCIGVVKVVLGMYAKKEDELIRTRSDLWQVSIADLKQVVDDHKDAIKSLNLELEQVKKTMALHQKTLETDLAARQKFVDAIEKRFEQVEQQFGKVVIK